eukprot:g4091.t1
MASKLKELIHDAQDKLDRLRIDRETMYLDIWDDIRAGIKLPDDNDIKDRYEYDDPQTLVSDSIELIGERVSNAIQNSRDKLIEIGKTEQKLSLDFFKLLQKSLSKGTSSIGEEDNLISKMKRGDNSLVIIGDEDEDDNAFHAITDLDQELGLGVV